MPIKNIDTKHIITNWIEKSSKLKSMSKIKFLQKLILSIALMPIMLAQSVLGDELRALKDYPVKSAFACARCAEKALSYSNCIEKEATDKSCIHHPKKFSYKGVKYILAPVPLFQNKINSVDLFKTNFTPSDEEIKKLFSIARVQKIKIILMPIIEIVNNDNSSYSSCDIGFNSEIDWVKWFKSYGDFIYYYARMAEKNNVEIFCVGAELSFTTQRADLWKQLIASVREMYSGKLLYITDCNTCKNISFWKDLDMAAITSSSGMDYLEKFSDKKSNLWGWYKKLITAWLAIFKIPVMFL
ncbi:conserved hypothetical protein, secreted [Candidatus Omnitrophus magneticus]|uniref:Uncharacterized protein n=1 Tax=Candidatus Omnitrophus magneticus TaxID=1609969 RepID=A0A0F0CQW4_9BACT|nr:conserved hypothetical protein, secreted [Candidatus Omnitrophus magneticus]